MSSAANSPGGSFPGTNLIACPRCDGKVGMGEDSVVHTIPACAAFTVLETMDEMTLFMREARHAVYGLQPDEALS